MLRIAAAIDVIAALAVEPGVTDDPVPLREHARGQGRVPWCGLRGGVKVVGVGEDDALIEQPSQPMVQKGAEALQVVGPHLVDDDHDNEPGRAFGDGPAGGFSAAGFSFRSVGRGAAGECEQRGQRRQECELSFHV